jgi:uncharacterized low-complexity protein
MNTTNKSISLAVAGAFALSMGAVSIQAAENPFAIKSLSSGYQVADATTGTKMKDGKCGTGKCGANKKAKMEKVKMEQEMADKGKEAACSAEMKKSTDGKCSADMQKESMADKTKEGSCSAEMMKGKEGSCHADKK